jgi:DNA (cytosine-5)-methyltransferase 1
MTAYYNEIDEYAAQWLRNLTKAGHIAPGDVDTRSIEDVTPDDIKGYTQCHFFAGIGVWSYALRRAGWPDDRPVWTGSCPCQPFSVAGKGDGFDDERHLWPAFHWLIEQRRPVAVFGEQVASKDGYAWLDLVQADMEGTGYTVGAVVAPAAGFGAPHQRHRMYWVADTADFGQHGRGSSETGNGRTPRVEPERLRDVGRLADAEGERERTDESGRNSTVGQFMVGAEPGCYRGNDGPTRGFWSAADWIYCRDEKYRPVEPGTFPLAHGATARVGRLRAYGNAICAPQAEEFIKAYLGVRP